MTAFPINPTVLRGEPLDDEAEALRRQFRTRVRQYAEDHPDEAEDPQDARNRRFMASERYP